MLLNIRNKQNTEDLNRTEILNNISKNLDKKLKDIELKKLELLLTNYPIKLQFVLNELDKQITL